MRIKGKYTTYWGALPYLFTINDSTFACLETTTDLADDTDYYRIDWDLF